MPKKKTSTKQKRSRNRAKFGFVKGRKIQSDSDKAQAAREKRKRHLNYLKESAATQSLGTTQTLHKKRQMQETGLQKLLLHKWKHTGE